MQRAVAPLGAAGAERCEIPRCDDERCACDLSVEDLDPFDAFERRLELLVLALVPDFPAGLCALDRLADDLAALFADVLLDARAERLDEVRLGFAATGAGAAGAMPPWNQHLLIVV